MKILVTGATANIGRKVIDQLLARGATDVRALTTNPMKAGLPAGVEVARGYLRRLETLPAAFEEVDRLYLAPTPDTATEVMKLAREAGIEHVVDLSGDPDNWWAGVMNAVENSGLAWTHLWPNDFMENSFTWKQQVQEHGAVREPNANAASAPIAMDDIAAVAAEALLGDDHAGKAHALVGPEILTRAQLVHTIGAALGRDIEFLQVTPAETIEALRPTAGDNAEWVVNNVLSAFEENPDLPTDSVQRITGCPATTFAEWAAAHTADFE